VFWRYRSSKISVHSPLGNVIVLGDIVMKLLWVFLIRNLS
jgi:hypothetical protein